ncbi:hypothetical protein QTO34_000675 [Cnephaeus nilssonii]|uniref:Uncharacterized protein n=1 Tax=Cnephaeus nilssonii TaxID=3371016 RepID=A0AA40LUV8_CNENI|nr:hypothetical protein QTO34_000675 [Eptesicus nilssonii]
MLRKNLRMQRRKKEVKVKEKMPKKLRMRRKMKAQTSRFLPVLRLARFPPTVGIRNHTLFQAKSDLSVVQ